jgi:prophage regulatory protein
MTTRKKVRKQKQKQTRSSAATSKPTAVGRLANVRAVSEMTSLSRAMIYEMARRGAFPAPVQLTDRRVAWRQADVAAWLESRERVSWAS